jgi:hypothetical protein
MNYQLKSRAYHGAYTDTTVLRLKSMEKSSAKTSHARRHTPFPSADSHSAAISSVRSRVLLYYASWSTIRRSLCCVWLMCSLVPSSPAPCWPAEAAATLAPQHRSGIGSRGAPLYGAIRATPSLPTQTGPAPPREDATRTRAGVRVAAAWARHAGARAARGARDARAAARRGRLAGRRVGGGAGGRRARAARVELSSILGGLTARTRGTPAHLRQSLPPPLPASRLEGGSTSAGIGARRALGIVAAIWGRRGMVGGTAVINQAFKEYDSHSSQNYLRTREREEWLRGRT